MANRVEYTCIYISLLLVLLVLLLGHEDGLLELVKAQLSVIVHVRGTHESGPQVHLGHKKKQLAQCVWLCTRQRIETCQS